MHTAGQLFLACVAGVVIAVLASFGNGFTLLPSRNSSGIGEVTRTDHVSTLAERAREYPIELPPGAPIDELVDLLTLKKILLRMAPNWDTFKITKALHAVELWGTNVEFPPNLFFNAFESENRIASTDLLMRALVSSDAHRALAPLERPLYFRSASGVGVREGVSDIGLEGAITHRDAMLSVFAEAGLPKSQVLSLDGVDATVADLLTHAMLELDDLQELEWTVNALVRYIPPRITEWKNRHGDTISIDLLTRRLLDRGIGKGSCYGTHVIYTVAAVSRVDEALPILSDGTRAQVADYFRRVVAALDQSQTPRGSWPKLWIDDVESLPIEDTPNMPSFRQPGFQEVASTGHHLDWIAIAPQQFRPSNDRVVLAGRFMTNEMRRLGGDKLAFFYIQFTHAARALCLLSGVHPAVLAHTSDADIMAGRVSRIAR